MSKEEQMKAHISDQRLYTQNSKLDSRNALWRTGRGSLQTLWPAFLMQLGPSKTSSYQEVHWLNDVQEDLIFPVLDTLWPPGDSVGDCGGGSRGSSV